MKTKEIIISFVKKFKLESIAIVVTSLIATVVFDMEKIEENKFLEVFIILSFVATGSFLVDKIFVIYEDFIKQKIAIKNKGSEKLEKRYLTLKIIFYIVVVLIEYLLYQLSIHLYGSLESDRMAYGFLLNTMTVSLISYLIIKEKNINIKHYLLKVFNNLLFVFTVECVVLVGFLVLCFIYEALLGSIPYFVISKIMIFTITLISTMGPFLSMENVEGEHNLFSKVVVRYIMQIMVFVGFIIFYIYFVKIIIKLEMPSNQVYSVCTTLFILGLPISLMSLGILEESIYKELVKFLPIAFIPVLILQIISIFIRINHYGITTQRYVGVVFIIFEAVYVVLYILDEILQNKKVKLENIFLVFCIMIFILFFVPKINVHEFPEICNSIFAVKG